MVHDTADLQKLGEEFAKLRTTLFPLAQDAKQQAALGAVASAEIAAEEGKRPAFDAALAMLGTGAKWMLDVAKENAMPLAAAIKSCLESPPT